VPGSVPSQSVEKGKVSLPGIGEFLEMDDAEFKSRFGKTALLARALNGFNETSKHMPMIKKRSFEKRERNGIL
jgi:hypothetical protein